MTSQAYLQLALDLGQFLGREGRNGDERQRERMEQGLETLSKKIPKIRDVYLHLRHQSLGSFPEFGREIDSFGDGDPQGHLLSHLRIFGSCFPTLIFLVGYRFRTPTGTTQGRIYRLYGTSLHLISEVRIIPNAYVSSLSSDLPNFSFPLEIPHIFFHSPENLDPTHISPSTPPGFSKIMVNTQQERQKQSMGSGTHTVQC